MPISRRFTSATIILPTPGCSSTAMTIPTSVCACLIRGLARSTRLWSILWWPFRNAMVRVQGGAYGGFCALDHRSGNFTYLSYRDPNLLETLDIYDQTPGFPKRAELDKTQLTRSIIGTIGDVDAYQLPDAKGCTSMQRYLAGEADDIRQRRRDEILGASVADFRTFADALAELTAYGQVVVLGSEQAI